MMRRFFIITLSVIFFLVPLRLWAQAIPLKNMSLRIVFAHQSETEITQAPKIVEIQKTSKGLKTLWYSLQKQRDPEAFYPTYKIRSGRGLIEVSDFENRSVFFHPSLWGNGYVRTEAALPLWLDPVFLDIKSRKEKHLNIGLINANRTLIKAAPDALFEKIAYLQNLYDQYVSSGDDTSKSALGRSDQKALKKFVRSFFKVKNTRKTKSDVYVNGVKESYPVRVIGNEYYHITVIDDPLNPLVIKFELMAGKVPKIFKRSFKDLKKQLDFYVTQIRY